MDRIEEFIHRRFSQDCEWISGNCYYFAIILKSRFAGSIVYDLIDGHFLFMDLEHKLYDWTGLRDDIYYDGDRIVDWQSYADIDLLHYKRIRRDCIL